MTKAPSDKAKSSREARLQKALRANLMRRKVQLRARRDAATDTLESDMSNERQGEPAETAEREEPPGQFAESDR
ncbi:hypothetical protein [Jiella mangrovi]|uniref:DUF4169 family protein n=1 Tax=Jiella mangrovi TaxID=2821407 RepID=A0ABS4BMD6_9HYPH|nr:hypothetical protein [Jiella mangrovi]MBP0617344.1 hypothetical protein [Jiella mangrovi]